MTVVQVKIPGSLMVQQDISHGNVVNSDQEGVVYNPNPSEIFQQDGYFKHTFHPMINSNFAWNMVKINWTRSSINTPIVFNTTFTLEGILLDGSVELLGEKIITYIPNSSTITEDVIFDLRNSRSIPHLNRIGTNIAPSGKISLQLPKRWLFFNNIKLYRAWINGWTKRKKVPISVYVYGQDYVLRRVPVTYDSDMKTDFSDIRFTASDGVTFLCSERESYTASSSAVFNVLIPASKSFTHIYMYYGNSSATLPSINLSTLFKSGYYDGFEDGKVSGRSSPYRNWVPTAGTVAINTANKISGSYSLQHTGQAAGTFLDFMGAVMNDSLSNYFMTYQFKLVNQGTYVNTPRVNLAILRYKDATHYLVVDSYYDGTYQKVRVIENNGGGSYIKLGPVNWLTGKIPVGTVYDIKVIDRGNWFTFAINNTNLFNQQWSSVEPNGLKGMGCNNDTSAVFDNIRISPYYGSCGTVGGEETNNTGINPDSALENDTLLSFTLPGWSDESPCYVSATELNHSAQITNNVNVSNRDLLELGYNSVDRYQALRLGVYIKADRNCNVRFNSLDYVYEVI